jgi:hypothetical protein
MLGGTEAVRRVAYGLVRSRGREEERKRRRREKKEMAARKD